MAAKLTPAQRDDYTRKAYDLSLRGFRAAEIGRSLGISERTVDLLLKRERARQWDSLTDEEKHGALSQFEGEHRAAMAEAWKRLSSTKDNSLNVSGLIGNILTASKNIATARGVFVEKHEIKSTVQHSMDMSGYTDEELRAIVARARASRSGVSREGTRTP